MGGLGARPGGGWGECGELAGAPEVDQVGEAVDEAQEAGDDHGVQGVGQPCRCVLGRDGGAQGGEAFVQQGWLIGHVPNVAN